MRLRKVQILIHWPNPIIFYFLSFLFKFLRFLTQYFFDFMTLDLMLIPVADIISAVEFNHDGELLATGDKGGRVVIFQRNDLTVSHSYLRLYTISHYPRYHTLRSNFQPVSLSESNNRKTVKRIQRLQHIPIARSRIRLPQVFRN